MRIKTISFILLAVFTVASCTREDLTGCFDTSGVDISFRYEWEGSAIADLPLQRADLYLFDANERFVYSLTDSIGPFKTSRTYNISLLPGNYTAVAWGNHNKTSFKINPSTFVAGETTLNEARILLAGTTELTRTGEATLKGPSIPLYHAIERNITVDDQTTTKTVMNLKRNTKQINLSVRFRHRDGTPCDDASHHCTPTIRSNDGILNFENSRMLCQDFLYGPTTKNDITGGFNALFNKMQLNIDEQAEIILTKSDGSGEVFYSENLIRWLKGTGFATQEKLDGTHVYDIELFFTCDHDLTHVTVTIFVNGWQYIETSDEV